MVVARGVMSSPAVACGPEWSRLRAQRFPPAPPAGRFAGRVFGGGKPSPTRTLALSRRGHRRKIEPSSARRCQSVSSPNTEPQARSIIRMITYERPSIRTWGSWSRTSVRRLEQTPQTPPSPGSTKFRKGSKPSQKGLNLLPRVSNSPHTWSNPVQTRSKLPECVGGAACLYGVD